MLLKWSALRGIGGLPVMKVTVVAPFVPYLLAAIEYIAVAATAPIVPTSIAKHWASSASNSLLFFYFGATLLGIGSAIYLVCVPRCIARYADSIEYAEREARHSTGPTGSSAGDVAARLRNTYESNDLRLPAARRLIFLLYAMGFGLLFSLPAYRLYETLVLVAKRIVVGLA
jgi:hypothetical protein